MKELSYQVLKSRDLLIEYQRRHPSFPNAQALVELRDKVNEEHALHKIHTRQAIWAAYRAGLALLEVKKILPHGQFTNWLDAWFDGSRESARGYIRVAENWKHPDVRRAKQNAAATLSGLLKVIRQIDEPKDPPAKSPPNAQTLATIRAEFAYHLKFLTHFQAEVCEDDFIFLWHVFKKELLRRCKRRRFRRKKLKMKRKAS